MPDAFMASTTSPGPGVGSGKSSSASSQSPRNTTPFMAFLLPVAQATNVITKGKPFRNRRVRPRPCRPVDLEDGFLAIPSYSGTGRSERASKLAISTRIEIDGHVASERAPGFHRRDLHQIRLLGRGSARSS